MGAIPDIPYFPKYQTGDDRLRAIIRIGKELPRPIRSAARKILYSPVDIIDLLLGRRDELIPPKRMLFSSARSFKSSAQKFFKYFVELGQLKPNERVLEVGCGIGRMAIPLTKYLSDRGSYEGFDIIADEINWCRKKISPKYPNFLFQFVDIYNKEYNPKGKYKASEYKFPYEDESFDFVFLTSVFTHMLPRDVENYLSEIIRVLKRTGRCLITFFLLNTESSELIGEKLSTLNFKYDFGVYSTVSKRIPEYAVAYDEKFVRNLYEEHGLSIVEPIRYGYWCGRRNWLTYQDIIVAIKKGNSLPLPASKTN